MIETAQSSSTIAERVLSIAETWIGTPYRHQGSLIGVGCDCLGLVRGIWRELYGEEPEAAGPYRADWAEPGGDERLVQAAIRHFGPARVKAHGVDRAAIKPGDLLVFAWQAALPACHLGIAAQDGRFIHAWERGAVMSSPLVPAWRRRIVAIHPFPEI